MPECHTCPICAKSYTQRQSATRHMAIKHPRSPEYLRRKRGECAKRCRPLQLVKLPDQMADVRALLTERLPNVLANLVLEHVASPLTEAHDATIAQLNRIVSYLNMIWGVDKQPKSWATYSQAMLSTLLMVKFES